MNIQKHNIVGVILAGGLARRMGGGDKCLLEIGGQCLLARTIDRLYPQVKKIVLNANGDEARFKSFALPIVKDTIDDFAGPLAGVLAGMRWTQQEVPGASHIVTIASDTPFFPLDLTTRFLQATKGKERAIALASTNGRVHPVFGLWPVELADHLEEQLHSGMRKVLEWAQLHEMIEVPFETQSSDQL